MKIFIDRILGHLSDFPTEGKKVDVVRIQWHESNKKILHKNSKENHEVSFKLIGENQFLQHNDVIYEDHQLIIAVEIEAVESIVVQPSSFEETVRLCYEIGNKHAPLFLEEKDLILSYEYPLFKWLQDAGFSPKREKRILSNPLRANSVQSGHHHEHKHE